MTFVFFMKIVIIYKLDVF